MYLWSSSLSLGTFDWRKGRTNGLTGNVVISWSCRRNSGTEVFPARRLITFLLTPAPAETEIPSLKLIRVIRNFLIFSVSMFSACPWPKMEKPAMPSPLRTAAMPTVLGITRWVGGTGTVQTDTGVVTLLKKRSSLSSSSRVILSTFSTISHWWLCIFLPGMTVGRDAECRNNVRLIRIFDFLLDKHPRHFAAAQLISETDTKFKNSLVMIAEMKQRWRGGLHR